MPKRILVSNDDGLFHPALWALVRAVKPLGEVVVSAPDRNCSGVGTAMTLHNPVRVNESPSMEPGVRAYAVQGTPGDSVVVGLRELAGGPVDAVITGINPGNNVTTNVLVSGTLGAAYAGHLNGARAMAVSVGYKVDTSDATLQRCITAAVGQLLAHEDNALVNLNFPWAEDWPLKGCKVTKPAPRILEDLVRVDEETGSRFYWLYRGLVEGADFDRLPRDSDVLALRESYVSVSSMGWHVDEARDAALMEGIRGAVESAIRG
jgi:5'-nucleotidase